MFTSFVVAGILTVGNISAVALSKILLDKHTSILKKFKTYIILRYTGKSKMLIQIKLL